MYCYLTVIYDFNHLFALSNISYTDSFICTQLNGFKHSSATLTIHQLEYTDFSLYLYGYTHKVSTDASFGLLQLFLLKSGAFEELRTVHII